MDFKEKQRIAKQRSDLFRQLDSLSLDECFLLQRKLGKVIEEKVPERKKI